MLRIEILGGCSISISGVPCERFRSRSSQILLARLVLARGRRVDRVSLAEIRWPDSETSQALVNLRQSLADIRRVLGPESHRLLSFGQRELAFNVEDIECDVLEFDRLIARGDLESLDLAIRAYRGPLLAGCGGEDIAVERDFRHLRALAALEQIGESELESGGFDDCEQTANQLMQFDSLNEKAAEFLIRCRCARRDFSGAHRLLLEFERRCVRLLGAYDRTPLERLLAKESTMRQAEPNAVPNEQTWPHAPNPIYGRDQEISRLARLVSEESLVSVVGLGGVGKSRLGIAVADHLSGTGGKRVEWRNSAELDRPELDRLARMLDGVLIIDESENSDADVLEWLRDAGFGSLKFRVLCLGRVAIGAPTERVFRLPPLSTDATQSETPAAQLFLHVRERRTGEVDRSVQTIHAAEAICERLAGVPLAVVLAANASSGLSMNEASNQVEALLTTATTLGVGESSGRGTIAETVSWSLRRVEPFAAELTQFLAAFDFSIPFDYVQICLPHIGLSAAVTAIESGLVSKSEHLGTSMYSVHAVVRSTIRARSSYLSRVRATEQTLALAVVERMRFVGELPHSADRSHLRARAGIDLPLVRFALEYAARNGDSPSATTIAAGIWGILITAGHVAEARRILELAVSITAPDSPDAIRVTNGLGFVERIEGHLDRSEVLHQQAIEASLRIKHKPSELLSRQNLAVVRSTRGDFLGMIADTHEIIELAKELRDDWWRGTLLAGMACAQSALGQLVAAERNAKRASKILASAGESEVANQGDLALVQILQDQNRIEDALEIQALLLEAAHKRQDVRGELVARINYASLAFRHGEPENAVATIETSLAEARSHGYTDVIQLALMQLGHLQLSLGHLEESEDMFLEALNLTSASRQIRHCANALLGMARVASQSDEQERAAVISGYAWLLLFQTGAATTDTMPTAIRQLLARPDDAKVSSWLEQGRQMNSAQAWRLCARVI